MPGESRAGSVFGQFWSVSSHFFSFGPTGGPRPTLDKPTHTHTYKRPAPDKPTHTHAQGVNDDRSATLTLICKFIAQTCHGRFRNFCVMQLGGLIRRRGNTHLHRTLSYSTTMISFATFASCTSSISSGKSGLGSTPIRLNSASPLER